MKLKRQPQKDDLLWELRRAGKVQSRPPRYRREPDLSGVVLVVIVVVWLAVVALALSGAAEGM